MQTLGPLLLSIAMLAAFALGAGGMWLIVKRRDAKKGVLMLEMALVLLGNVLIWALPVPGA
jgi:hypothetical protein